MSSEPCFDLFSLCVPLSRLHSNNLHCDCQLSWLSDWLRARRGLAPFTQCMAPANMRGLNVPDVPKKDFVCNGKVTLTHKQRFSLLLFLFFFGRRRTEALSSHVLFNVVPAHKNNNMEYVHFETCRTSENCFKTAKQQ